MGPRSPPAPAEVLDGDPTPQLVTLVLPWTPNLGGTWGWGGGPQGAGQAMACPCPAPISTAEPVVHGVCTGCARGVRVCACVCAACARTQRCRQRSPAAVQREIESLLSLASLSLGWFF